MNVSVTGVQTHLLQSGMLGTTSWDPISQKCSNAKVKQKLNNGCSKKKKNYVFILCKIKY